MVGLDSLCATYEKEEGGDETSEEGSCEIMGECFMSRDECGLEINDV